MKSPVYSEAPSRAWHYMTLGQSCVVGKAAIIHKEAPKHPGLDDLTRVSQLPREGRQRNGGSGYFALIP